MEKQPSTRHGAVEKLKSFRAMEKQQSFKRNKDSPGKRGDTELHLAARAGSVAHVQRILAGCNPELVVELAARQNQDGETALYVSAEKGHVEVVCEILKASDVQSAGLKASNSFDAFHIAAKKGHLDVLKELLKAFPSLAMTTNSVNATALDTAATQGHIDIVNLLLETDASLARIARNNGKTVLHSAARMGHVEVVTALLNKDPGIGFRTDKKGQTALHMASKGQNAEILLALLKPDVSVIHVEDGKGNRPLHVATRKGNTIMVQTLLSVEGIEINAVNRAGETAFAIAEKQGNEELINILREVGGETAKEQVNPPNPTKQLKQTVRHDVQSQTKQTRQTKMQFQKIKKRIQKLHIGGRNNAINSTKIFPPCCRQLFEKSLPLPLRLEPSKSQPSMAAASAVIDRLLRRLASIGPDELPSDVDEDMIHLKKALSRWYVVLESMEKQLFEGVSEEHLETSKALMSKENKMRKIKQIAYYIEDILDEFEGCGRSGSGGSSGRSEEVFCCSSGPSFLPSTMASRMKMVRKKLDRESEKSIIFQLLHHSKPDLVTTDGHGPSDLNSIIGRENDRANIKIIINDAGPFSIIPIVGLSGIGKTALARLIFNDRGEDCKFDHHIWISLNMSFDLCYIVNGIISQAGHKEEGPSQNKWTLRNLLQEVLTDKRSLVVLDDLWSMDRNQLDELKEMMSTVICSVIVTTSSEEVAKLFNTVSPYKLGPLSDSDCWTIFSGVASEDQETRDHVVRLCQGMPIVAHYLSSVVHAKGKNVLKDASNKELWHLEKQLVPKVKMFRPLKKIYYRMPSGLKSCLGYLSIFPKGFHIDIEKLIWQWSALDMLGSSHGILSPYVQGKNYIQSLLSIFFLQAPDPCSANGMVLTNGKNVLQMHSLVHSFARYLSCDELIILEDQIAPVRSKKKVTCRYALLLECNEASVISKGFLTRARAVSFKGCKGRQLPEEALSALRHLNVLDLSGCSFPELPSSVGQLKHLRYLDVSHSAVQSLPSELRHLQNLEALDLSRTSVSVPLDPIGPFPKLKYLNLQECPNLRDLLPTFGDLNGLEHLNLSRCSGVSELPETLCGFSALQLLDLSGCAELEKLPQSLGSLKNLGDLNLSGCSRLEQLSESFHELYSLKFLNLESCSMLQQLPHLFGNLKTLEILNLAGCISLQELPKSFGDLYFLRVLNLEGCFGLQESPEFLGSLLNLENLNLSHISLELPEALINLRRLHTLDLTGCGFKKSFADIVNKMTNLKFVLTDDSRLALSFSRHIIVSTENNEQSCLASHMVQSSDLERDGIMGETGAEEILETPETRKGTIDRANPQQETSNPFQLIATENKASSADVFGYSSENVECSAEDSLETTIEMQPHRQGKEETPTEEDAEDFNPRASSTLSSRISDSLNTTVEKQTDRQGKKENPVKQDIEDFSPCASSTVNRLPEKQRKEQGQEISEYSSDDEQHSQNISGRQDGNLNDSTTLDNLADKGKPWRMPWRKTLLAPQNAITWKKQEYRSDSKQMYHLVKKEKSLQVYTFSRIKVATLNFSDRIGSDGFASYYKGQLSDGVEIVVKRYSGDGTQAKNEIEVTTGLLHRNILRPRGCCFERKPAEMSCCIKGNNEEQIILIYDYYMPNNSLDYFIFDTEGKRRLLDWPERRRIIYGIAQGLIYLHEYSEFTVIHLDIKPYNILLDNDMNPKIRNFDISTILPSGVTEEKENICGTIGYLDPWFYATGICSVKSDVYSFGITMLEIISGEKSLAVYQEEGRLPSRACRLWMDGNWHEIIDPKIYHTLEDTEIKRFIHVALLCIQNNPEDRPTMHDVTEMLRHESIFRPEPKLLLHQYEERSEGLLSDQSEEWSEGELTVVKPSGNSPPPTPT